MCLSPGAQSPESAPTALVVGRAVALWAQCAPCRARTRAPGPTIVDIPGTSPYGDAQSSPRLARGAVGPSKASDLTLWSMGRATPRAAPQLALRGSCAVLFDPSRSLLSPHGRALWLCTHRKTRLHPFPRWPRWRTIQVNGARCVASHRDCQAVGAGNTCRLFLCRAPLGAGADDSGTRRPSGRAYAKTCIRSGPRSGERPTYTRLRRGYGVVK